MPYVQDVAGSHQCESEHCSNISIKYFRNTEIKHGAILTYIYFTRVTACTILISDNIYQTNKLNPWSTVNLKNPFIMPLIKAEESTERISGDIEIKYGRCQKMRGGLSKTLLMTVPCRRCYTGLFLETLRSSLAYASFREVYTIQRGNLGALACYSLS